MNTAKSTTQSGSKSSNPMVALNSKKQEQQERVSASRAVFAGQKFTVIFTDVSLGIVVFRQVMDSGKIYMMGFSGKRTKPDFYFGFSSLEKSDSYIQAWHKALINYAARKAERRAVKATKMAQQQTDLVVGDVLVASWGYEQTNYEYYQVTRLVGKRSVEIRELCKFSEETAWLQGDCVPVKNHFKSEPMIKRVDESGAVKVRSWGVYASKKESLRVASVEVFKPDHYTAYA